MSLSLSAELKSFFKSLAELDRQTVVVLVLASVLGMWKFTFGSPEFFATELASAFGIGEGEIWNYAYLCIAQGIMGFVIPVLILVFVFHRRPGNIGLGLGDVRFGVVVILIYIPIATIGCWFLSGLDSFQTMYPMFKGAADGWGSFIVYELLFLIYWIGWEYLWRGFLLFGTAHTFGRWSIIIQMLPFAALHAWKPMPEAYLSIVGALILGAIVWRCRSFWIAIPLHAYQMFMMDLFCTLRH